MDAGRGIVVIILDFGTTRCIRNLVAASNATPLYDLGEVEAAVSLSQCSVSVVLHVGATVTGRTNRWNLGTFQKAVFFRYRGASNRKVLWFSLSRVN